MEYTGIYEDEKYGILECFEEMVSLDDTVNS